jgi:aspartokinase/homoserine dehydrogenase 1
MEIDKRKKTLCPRMFETTTNEAFFESLQEHAEHFESIYKEALSKESRLKYVAQFENGKQMFCDSFLKTIHFTI